MYELSVKLFTKTYKKVNISFILFYFYKYFSNIYHIY